MCVWCLHASIDTNTRNKNTFFNEHMSVVWWQTWSNFTLCFDIKVPMLLEYLHREHLSAPLSNYPSTKWPAFPLQKLRETFDLPSCWHQIMQMKEKRVWTEWQFGSSCNNKPEKLKIKNWSLPGCFCSGKGHQTSADFGEDNETYDFKYHLILFSYHKQKSTIHVISLMAWGPLHQNIM